MQDLSSRILRLDYRGFGRRGGPLWEMGFWFPPLRPSSGRNVLLYTFYYLEFESLREKFLSGGIDIVARIYLLFYPRRVSCNLFTFKGGVEHPGLNSQI